MTTERHHLEGTEQDHPDLVEGEGGSNLRLTFTKAEVGRLKLGPTDVLVVKPRGTRTREQNAALQERVEGVIESGGRVLVLPEGSELEVIERVPF
jgi:hypothetical protein